MKTLSEYLTLPYKMEVVEEPDEGGFVISFPDLPGCITSGETLEMAIKNGIVTSIKFIVNVTTPSFLFSYHFIHAACSIAIHIKRHIRKTI